MKLKRFPNYVLVTKDGINGTTMHLSKVDPIKEIATYYRPAGCWDLKVKWSESDPNILKVHRPYRQIKHLINAKFIIITRNKFLETNRGYVSGEFKLPSFSYSKIINKSKSIGVGFLADDIPF